MTECGRTNRVNTTTVKKNTQEKTKKKKNQGLYEHVVYIYDMKINKKTRYILCNSYVVQLYAILPLLLLYIGYVLYKNVVCSVIPMLVCTEVCLLCMHTVIVVYCSST